MSSSSIECYIAGVNCDLRAKNKYEGNADKFDSALMMYLCMYVCVCVRAYICIYISIYMGIYI